MNIDDIRSLDKIYVFKGERLAASISRTTHGALFEYSEQYHRDNTLAPIAYELPVEQPRVQTTGDNLHPFFAGLLPEGRRLTALISLVKTSADDLFSLLAATGTDCIGDVFVSAEPKLPDTPQKASLEDIDSISFADLFDQSIGAVDLSERSRDISVPGVQPKVSAEHLSISVSLKKRKKQYLLKLAPENFPKLVENEHFFMNVAAACGIPTAQTQIVHDKTGSSGLLVERFDRVWQASGFKRIHQEDACQFLSRYPQDKYRLSMQQIVEGLNRHATSPVIETARLLEITAFSYIIANGDLHAKNISLITEPESRRIILTPAYDLVSTLPYGDQNMALTLEGRKSNITAKHFIAWGERCGVREAAVRSILEKLTANIHPFVERLGEIGLEEKKTAFLHNTMLERLSQLT